MGDLILVRYGRSTSAEKSDQEPCQDLAAKSS